MKIAKKNRDKNIKLVEGWGKYQVNKIEKFGDFI